MIIRRKLHDPLLVILDSFGAYRWLLTVCYVYISERYIPITKINPVLITDKSIENPEYDINKLGHSLKMKETDAKLAL